jgi:hypothetical protein
LVRDVREKFLVVLADHRKLKLYIKEQNEMDEKLEEIIALGRQTETAIEA